MNTRTPFVVKFIKDLTAQNGGTRCAEVGFKSDRLYCRVYTAHRGGCLFAGSIEVYSLEGGYTRRSIDSTMGTALDPSLTVDAEAPRCTSDYLHSLCERFVKPLSELSASELERFQLSGEYTPDSMVAAWNRK